MTNIGPATATHPFRFPTMAKRLGFKKLVDIASFKYPYPHNAIATRKSFIRQNPEMLKGFLKAYLASIKIIHEQPEIAKKALADFLGSKDPEMIDDSYDSLKDLFLKVPYMRSRTPHDFIRHSGVAVSPRIPEPLPHQQCKTLQIQDTVRHC